MKVEVVDNIWIGDLFDWWDLPREYAVVTLLSNERLLSLANEFVDARENQIIWQIPDKVSAVFLRPRLLEVLEFIDIQSAQRPVMIHCAQGQSRSVSVCAAWLISRSWKKSLQDAMACIRRVRPQASPNLGFLAALKAIERHGGNVEAAIDDWNSSSK